MPAELISRVFERFQQGASTNDAPKPGLGLGLAIVKHIVERLGGSVDAHSDGLGHGSVFTVRIPVL